MGAAQCGTGMVVLGSSFAITRNLLGYPVLTGQAMRYGLAAAVLAGAVAWLRRGTGQGVRPTAGELARLCLLAATGLAAFNVCILETLRRSDPAVVGTAVGAAPVVIALLGPLTRGARPAARVTLAAVVVTAGAALVHRAGGLAGAGLGWAAGALACEAAFSMLAAPLLPRLGPTRVSAYACGFAAPMLVAAAAVAGERWQAPSPAETATLAFLALVLTAGVFPLWYSGVRRLTVERAGLFTGLLPVVTLVATALLDLRVPDPVRIAGVLCVCAGLAYGLTTAGASSQQGAPIKA